MLQRRGQPSRPELCELALIANPALFVPHAYRPTSSKRLRLGSEGNQVVNRERVVNQRIREFAAVALGVEPCLGEARTGHDEERNSSFTKREPQAHISLLRRTTAWPGCLSVDPPRTAKKLREMFYGVSLTPGRGLGSGMPDRIRAKRSRASLASGFSAGIAGL